MAITAPAAKLAERLLRRGREPPADILARVTRAAAPLPPDLSVITIENDAVLAVAAQRFIMALRQIAEGTHRAA